jgi:hypothetical protein
MHPVSMGIVQQADRSQTKKRMPARLLTSEPHHWDPAEEAAGPEASPVSQDFPQLCLRCMLTDQSMWPGSVAWQAAVRCRQHQHG